MWVNEWPVDEAVAPGRFAAITRTWKAGDTVSLDLPMRWRLVKGRQRQAGRVAVMRGPLLFCLNPAQNKTIAPWDAADLSRITLDPASMGEPVPDASVRPDGLACKVQAWKPSLSLRLTGDIELRLTEFPDPDGKATYFRLRDMAPAVDDELLPSTPTDGR